jgi:type II secretory pathway component GspD/PulD (secretin)
MYFWGAQLELGPTATPYQRVTTATDYADIGLPRYLAFDGFDDSLYTAANLDLSGTDKVTVCAGVTKLSDAAVGVIANLSSAPASNTGTFTLTAPENTTTVRYASAARGSAALGPNLRADITATGTAPDRAVITATHDIAGDLSTIRRNGVAGTNGTADKGTGNFGSYAFFVGRTNNATFPYNGQLNALIVRGTLTDPTTLALAEQWVAGKTGISLP